MFQGAVKFQGAVERLGVQVEFGAAARAQFAYDASLYRVVPQCVAYPRSVGEVVTLVNTCNEHGVPVTPRGGGTSMAGNAVGAGMVIDLSRFMNEVISVDPETKRAIVQGGVVLDDLQRLLVPYGLQFGPDPSSHSRATLGGMIGNDACGNHSVRYGRTVHHVIELEVVLADGNHLIAGRGGMREAVDGDTEAAARARQLNTALRTVANSNLGPIRLELGRISRQVSGYQLQHLLPENGFDVAKMLVGTEGSCAIVVAATISLVPTPLEALLIAVGYPDVATAADDVPIVLGYSPAAVEGMDESIVSTMRARRGHDSVAGLPDGSAWLFVDLDGDDAAQITARANELVEQLRARGRLTDARIISDPGERASLWRVREDGAGLSARPADGGQTWPGWEDSAVDPANLPDYLRDLRALLDRHGRKGVMYGHFGAGCIHMRIDFDFNTPDAAAAMGRFVREAAELVVHHGGTLSGEHGDGRARSELLSVMYSPVMLNLFAAVKDVFDPDSLLNPGVIVRPTSLTSDLAPLPLVDVRREAFTYPHDTHGFAEGVSRCVGIARCRSDVGGVMCPSYRATGDENHSTRGRARALQEMLRDDLIQGDWRSDAVAGALDLCLSCKACYADCPVSVDMATYKSEFLYQHYRHRPRPISHYSLGWLPIWAKIAGLAPGVVNSVSQMSAIHGVLARAGGITRERAVPHFVKLGVARKGLRPFVSASKHHDAVIFVDTFSRAFRPDLPAAAARVLAASGMTLRSSGGCCGLTWITTGQLSMAKRTLARTTRKLDATGSSPIIVLEPSCAAALRKDLPELVPTDAARRVADRVTTFAGALATRLDAGWQPPLLPERLVLQQHCHEYAVFGTAEQQHLLPQLGVTQVLDVGGCCGLAGNFGFERDHYDVSLSVADLSLTPALRSEAAQVAIAADGFSCQTQIQHLNPAGNAQPQHLAQMLARALNTSAKEPPRDVHTC